MKMIFSDKKRVWAYLNVPLAFCGILSTVLGLIYILNLPRLTSDATSTTVFWGWLAMIVGIIAMALAPGKRAKGLKKIFLCINLGIMILLQFPPMLLWFVFNGEVISDGPVGPVGHWFWAVPHIVLTVVAVYSLFYSFLYRDNSTFYRKG